MKSKTALAILFLFFLAGGFFFLTLSQAEESSKEDMNEAAQDQKVPSIKERQVVKEIVFYKNDQPTLFRLSGRASEGFFSSGTCLEKIFDAKGFLKDRESYQFDAELVEIDYAKETLQCKNLKFSNIDTTYEGTAQQVVYDKENESVVFQGDYIIKKTDPESVLKADFGLFLFEARTAVVKGNPFFLTSRPYSLSAAEMDLFYLDKRLQRVKNATARGGVVISKEEFKVYSELSHITFDKEGAFDSFSTIGKSRLEALFGKAFFFCGCGRRFAFTKRAAYFTRRECARFMGRMGFSFRSTDRRDG